MKFPLYAIRLALGALLLWSGLVKARQPFEFLAAVYSYQLVGPLPGVLIAALLPWIEVVVGCCLVAGILTEGAMLAAVLLTGSFSLAIASAWHRGLSIHCGCFGGADAAIGGQTVLRSLGLLLLALSGLLFALALRKLSAATGVSRGPRTRRPRSFSQSQRFSCPRRNDSPQSMRSATPADGVEVATLTSSP